VFLLVLPVLLLVSRSSWGCAWAWCREAQQDLPLPLLQAVLLLHPPQQQQLVLSPLPHHLHPAHQGFLQYQQLHQQRLEVLC
jgi:hypothetical protein